MIISLFGFIVMVFSVVRDEGVSVIGLIAGILILLFGLLVISSTVEYNKARYNRRSYWATGEKPDWKQEQEQKKANTKYVQAQYIGVDGKRGFRNGVVYGIEVIDNRFGNNNHKNYIVNMGRTSIEYGLKSSMEKDWKIL